ncbi:MAG: transcriptional regulator [Nitrosopumilales archaeon CG_4_9_14_0_8_um_filter_34_10]|nr:MAG: transcriptional regulator [Nitrosopumilales archaeon CG_4_9_14_0_8_um_filter_34_10]
MLWGDVSYVIASKTRKAILLKLETPRTPTFLAKDLGINLANVSRALTELESKDVVICLTPKQKVGKIYSMTKKGKDIVSQMKKMEE